jgi:hypothetical protein
MTRSAHLGTFRVSSRFVCSLRKGRSRQRTLEGQITVVSSLRHVGRRRACSRAALPMRRGSPTNEIQGSMAARPRVQKLRGALSSRWVNERNRWNRMETTKGDTGQRARSRSSGAGQAHPRLEASVHCCEPPSLITQNFKSRKPGLCRSDLATLPSLP